MAEPTLDMIPSYRRPLGAERVLGEIDELGNPVYRTPGGRKFSLVTMTGAEAEEQREMDRWPLSKVASDLRDTVWNYVTDPRVPSWDQVKRLPQALIQGTAEEIQSAREIPTPANILGLAVGAGTASMAGTAPKGALRVFGGLMSDEERLQNVLDDINNKAGTSHTTIEDAIEDIGPDNIYDEYGIFIGLDGMARYEIPDVEVTLTEGLVDSIDNEIAPDIKKEFEQPDYRQLTDDEYEEALLEINRKDTEGISYDGVTLGELLHHPQLYAAYPELEDLPVSIKVGGSAKQYNGAFFDMEKGIELSWDKLIAEPGGSLDELNEDILPTLMHEIQHAIQDLEGFDTGSNLSMTNLSVGSLPRIESNMVDVQNRLKFLETELADGETFLGRHNEWVNVRTNEVPREIRQMPGMKAAGRGWVKGREGWRYLQDGYFVEKADGQVEWRSGDPEVLSTLSHSTVTPEPMIRSPELYNDDITFQYKGITYYASPNAVHERAPALSSAKKDLLTQEYLTRVVQDGRSAFRKYLMTTGEVEANAVGSRLRLSRRLEKRFGADRTRRTLEEVSPESTMADEIEAAGGGDPIRRQNVPTLLLPEDWTRD